MRELENTDELLEHEPLRLISVLSAGLLLLRKAMSTVSLVGQKPALGAGGSTLSRRTFLRTKSVLLVVKGVEVILKLLGSRLSQVPFRNHD